MKLLAPIVAVAALASASTLARADDPPQVSITITDKGCEPAALTVSAGKTVFLIKNASSRRIEWEILDGVMVVEERENIVPGFVQKLTATLDGGSYGMTCGLLSNPKGTLTVTAKSGALPAAVAGLAQATEPVGAASPPLPCGEGLGVMVAGRPSPFCTSANAEEPSPLAPLRKGEGNGGHDG